MNTRERVHRHEIRLKVNGKDYRMEVEARKLLVDFLRYDLGLTGTHVGCEQGICGGCTVILNGEAINSCLMFAVQADGSEIRTGLRALSIQEIVSQNPLTSSHLTHAEAAPGRQSLSIFSEITCQGSRTPQYVV